MNNKNLNKKICVIIDRDGVINFDSKEYIKTPEEWVAIPGSLEAVAQLNQAGFKVAMATNQAGPAQGKYSVENAQKIFKKMEESLRKLGGHFDYIAKCEHHPKENCECRKPKPGLLLEIEKNLNIDLKSSVFIGDSLKDIQAAQSAGVKPVLVLTGSGHKTLESLRALEMDNNIDIYQDLSCFSRYLISHHLAENSAGTGLN